jgi:hypothetical protein
MPDLSALGLEKDGAALHAGVVTHLVRQLLADLPDLLPQNAGIRIAGNPHLAGMLAPSGPIGHIAAGAIGSSCRAVRAILFEKNANTNWTLGWHQDRTIVVRARHDVPGFGPWTVKQGLQHVAPPFPYLASMVTLRVHLDDVSSDNAPLRIAAGTHRLGLVAETAIAEVVRRHPHHDCIAQAGDIWIYATPILHASDRAIAVTRRRVLQVDYSAALLAAPLEWRGID